MYHGDLADVTSADHLLAMFKALVNTVTFSVGTLTDVRLGEGMDMIAKHHTIQRLMLGKGAK